MRIEFDKPLTVSDIVIWPGSYFVIAVPETQKIAVSGKGVTHYLPATSRPCKKPIRVAEALLTPGGSQDLWVLIARVPPKREWMTVLKIHKEDPRKKARKRPAY